MNIYIGGCQCTEPRNFIKAIKKPMKDILKPN